MVFGRPLNSVGGEEIGPEDVSIPSFSVWVSSNFQAGLDGCIPHQAAKQCLQCLPDTRSSLPCPASPQTCTVLKEPSSIRACFFAVSSSLSTHLGRGAFNHPPAHPVTRVTHGASDAVAEPEAPLVLQVEQLLPLLRVTVPAEEACVGLRSSSGQRRAAVGGGGISFTEN